MTNNQKDKQIAFNHILGVVAQNSSRALQLFTILVGFVSLTGMNLPPEWTSLVALGINEISNLIDRVSSGNKVSDVEIMAKVEEAFQQSRVEKLLEKSDFYQAFELIREAQRTTHKENELIYQTLHKLIPQDIKPLLPSVLIQTYDGLSFPDGTKLIITSEMSQKWRQHEIRIQNRNNFEIHNVSFRIQLPEAIMFFTDSKRPAGVEIMASPDLMEFESIVGGGGTVTLSGKKQLTGVWNFELEKLPANKFVSYTFVTSNVPGEQNYSMSVQTEYPGRDYADRLQYFLEGEFQFKNKDISLARKFVCPFSFSKDTRKLLSLGTQESFGTWIPIYISFG